MKALVLEKNRSVELRRMGKSYGEILVEVPVAKSTLSMWLKDLPLTNSEKEVLKHRKNSNISRGRIKAADANRKRRLARDAETFQIAKKEFEAHSDNPFFLVGIALYWAEGSKRSTEFGFTNSDSEMMRLMVDWINTFLVIPNSEISARLYSHKPYADENCEGFWAERTGIPMANFRKTIYKPTSLLVKKRPNYKGCLRIRLGKVSYLRKMLFWQKMVVEKYSKKG